MLSVTRAQQRADEHYVDLAKRWGCPSGIGRLIVQACRRYNLPISLGFALFEQESGFRNVFGHDPTNAIPKKWMGQQVTRTRYRYYKLRRKRYGMQGVGVGQLTWWETQDMADKRGGCWKSEHNIDVAVQTLAARVRDYGYVDGIKRYNGTGPAADAYSRRVRALADLWHKRLN